MPNCQHTGLPTIYCAHCNVSRFNTKETVVVKARPASNKIKPKKVTSSITFKLDDPNNPFLDLLGPITKTDPTVIICSFCGNSTSRVEMTEGVGDIKKSIRTNLEFKGEDPNRTMEADEVTSHFVIKVVACRECSHLVKPLVRADGSVKHQGTKFNPVND